MCGPFGSAIKLDDYRTTGVPLLRISDISDDGRINEQSLVFLEPAFAAKFPRSTVVPGDIVISQRGTLGIPALVPATYPKWCISANLIGIRRPKFDSNYVQAYLNFGPGRIQLQRAQSGQVQGKITTGDVAAIEIPESQIAETLVAALDTARVRRKKMLAKADALLAALDGLVLKQLGLILPQPGAHHPAYAVRLRDAAASNKLYPDFFHPERLGAIRAIAMAYKGDRCATLLSVADFRRDQRQVKPGDNYLGLANVQPNTGERCESTDEDGTGTVFEFAEHDVLFARLRPYLNKVYRAESAGVCSTEFHVMRVLLGKDGKPRVLPDYLAAVLRSGLVLAQTRHMMTGNTHPRLTNEDVVNLVIPVPEPEVQFAIAAEVAHRREQAKKLRAEAVALWEQAKVDFEAALLGPIPRKDGA